MRCHIVNGRSIAESWLKVPQTKLRTPGLLALLSLIAIMMPLALDMYTPAIPHMSEHLNTTESMVNLTLVGYNLFFAVGLLVFGPVSDRIGRKPVLVCGLAAYTAGSIACALAPTIEVLILARVVQATGAGAADALTNTIAKDALREDKRQTAISFIQLMFIVGPVAAPLVGAAVLTVAPWRATFVIIAAVGTLCLVLALLFEETLSPEEREAERTSMRAQFKTVLSRPNFTAFLAVFTLYNFAFMAYIAVAPFIYERFFGLTPMGYSLFFSASAIMTALGPFAWTFASRFTTPKRFLTTALLVSLFAGAAMVFTGTASPFLFALLFCVFAVCEAAQRPLTVNILLTQQDECVGTASSLINFILSAAGSLGMLVVHMPAPNYVVALGVTIALSMAVSLAGWFALLRSPISVRGLR